MAQDSVITVGVKESPPFIIVNEQKQVSGVSAEFWEMIDRDIPARIEYKVYPELNLLIEALRSGEVDMSINPITVTEPRMNYLDFSQPFFISGTTIARPESSRWLAFLGNFFSWRFLSASAILLGIIMVFGLLTWFFEKKANPEQFAKGWKGVADGFWWSAVTMTTVGYGDKAPVSKGGRIVAFIWMFAAILIISGLTASVASSLTVSTLDEQIGSVEDLRRFRLGSVTGSSSAEYASLFEVETQNFPTVEDALQALDKGDLQAVIYDRPILKYQLRQGNYDDLTLLGKVLKTDYYSFSYPKNSHLRDEIDPLVVRALKSQRWNYKIQQLQKIE